MITSVVFLANSITAVALKNHGNENSNDGQKKSASNLTVGCGFQITNSTYMKKQILLTNQ